MANDEEGECGVSTNTDQLCPCCGKAIYLHMAPGFVRNDTLDEKDLSLFTTTMMENEILKSRLAHLEAENAKLRDKTRWIPVSERLPEKDEIVFVLINWGGGDGIDWIDDNGEWWSYENVTHWMPRPEEPEGDEK